MSHEGDSPMTEDQPQYTETELLALKCQEIQDAHKALEDGTLETVTPEDLP